MKMELISYYHMTDLMEKPYRQANGQERPPNMLGLLHGLSYTPKKSYYAYKNLAAIFDSECKADDLACYVMDKFNFRQVGALPPLSIIAGTFVRRGYPVYSYYFAEDLQRCWGGLNDFGLQVVQQTERPIKTPVLIDVISGSVYRATDFEMLESDSVVIRGLPLTDYPLILTDIDAIELQPE